MVVPVVVVVAVVVAGFVQLLGPTLVFSQPEKLLMEHSNAAALAKRRMEVTRMEWGCEKG